MDSIVAWCARHSTFDSQLRDLRRVAPEGDRSRTLAALQALQAALSLHMGQEEALLWPAYAPLAETLPPNGSVRVLQADHDRLRALLASVSEAAEPRSAADWVAQQEALSLLAGVLEHHDGRELRWLAPTLDAHVPSAQRRRWLRRIEEEETALELPEPPSPRTTDHEPLPTSSPLQRLRVAVARDSGWQQALDELRAPLHRKGVRLHQRCATQLASAAATEDLAARRDALAHAADTLRLLALVVDLPHRAEAGSSRAESKAPMKKCE
ncbi:MAG: hemerythrin domain-containing protein [Myxococcales bacterium]|nr:hemerythrin domain-containing protein [Myxococcales bacterium]